MSTAAVHAAHLTAERAQTTGGGDGVLQQPSVFDAIAQESLMAGLHPALKHLVQFGSVLKPERFRSVARHYDEIYLALDLVLQDYFLKKYNGTFSENFYGMKRVGGNGSNGRLLPRERLLSLAIVSGLPYIRRKLDLLHERWRDEIDIAGDMQMVPGRTEHFKRNFVKIYPWLNTAVEVCSLVLQISYALSKSSVHSPLLFLAGVKLANLTAADFERFGRKKEVAWPENGGVVPMMGYLLRAFPTAVQSAASRSIGVALFFIQFIDWWHASGQVPIPDPVKVCGCPQSDRLNSSPFGGNSAPPPPHAMILKEDAVLQLNPRQCPLCQRVRRNDTVLAVSGYVFCYGCIFQFVESRQCCPVTQLPASKRHLVRLFAVAATAL